MPATSERCMCRVLEHGHGDHCDRSATEPDGMCKECHDKIPLLAEGPLRQEHEHPLHLASARREKTRHPEGKP